MPSRPTAKARRIEDNERVHITEWCMPPGSQTGWHIHQYDYVVIYRTAAKHIVETRNGIEAVDVTEGDSFFRRRGIEHNVINAGATEVVLVEIELK